MRTCFLLIAALLWIWAWAATAHAANESACRDATRSAERATGVPDQLLTAISRVESGRFDPQTGRTEAWPWTINVEGVGHVYDTEAAAIAAVASFQAQGARSIDVGCMQINLKQHPDAFASLADAFDPTTNANFAAHFLTELFGTTGSWPHAAAAYHSQTPDIGRDYQNQVLQIWAEGDGPSAPRKVGRPRPAQAAPSASLFASVPSGGASPFGGTPSAFVAQRYGPKPAVLMASGRDLTAYRSRPIALAARIVPLARY